MPAHTFVFSPREFTSADSAFACTPTCMPQFKKPSHGVLTREQECFNFYNAKGRVKSEHCFGMAKGKWQSLKGIRVKINTEGQYTYCVKWILACLVLHNLALDDWDDTAWEDYHEDAEDDEFWQNFQCASISEKEIGQAQRNYIMLTLKNDHPEFSQ